MEYQSEIEFVSHVLSLVSLSQQDIFCSGMWVTEGRESFTAEFFLRGDRTLTCLHQGPIDEGSNVVAERWVDSLLIYRETLIAGRGDIGVNSSSGQAIRFIQSMLEVIVPSIYCSHFSMSRADAVRATFRLDRLELNREILSRNFCDPDWRVASQEAGRQINKELGLMKWTQTQINSSEP